MAVISNLTVDQGTTFNAEIEVTDNVGDPLNLNGYTATGQIRKTYSSSTAIDFSTEIPSPASNGKVVIGLTATQTNLMKAGRYVYDVEITNDSGVTVTRILEGQVEVLPGVTRG